MDRILVGQVDSRRLDSDYTKVLAIYVVCHDIKLEGTTVGF